MEEQELLSVGAGEEIAEGSGTESETERGPSSPLEEYCVIL